MCEAFRAGAFSRRWRNLPRRLSLLHLDVRQFGRDTSTVDLGAMSPAVETMLAFTGLMSSAVEAMQAFTGALLRSLSASPPPVTLSLCFFPVTNLTSIGRAVEDVVTRGETKYLEFHIRAPDGHSRLARHEFMSFSRACPVAFRWLTMLTFDNIAFDDSDIPDLISACDRLRHLTLSSCSLVEFYSPLEIHTPCSRLQKLFFIDFDCRWIALMTLPRLTELRCQSWRSENPRPVRFGQVPELRRVSLISRATPCHAPLALSECIQWTPGNLSNLHLDFVSGMIWIQMEHPKQLTAKFRNLTNVELFGIFPKYDLSWTIFFLEAAPALQNFRLSREGHLCTDYAIKTNVVWKPSKNFKHLNLKLLRMSGFEDEDKVANYIRLVMKRTVWLKRIELHGENPCKKCDAIDPTSRRPHVDEARRRRIKEKLTHKSSSSVEIIIC
ncbi:hypothetical protein TRIUR3_32592 [Triticum urartu]|uniref:At1g61320/AtMIF1 LRR domain-containing protein n=2 Tax=Triticum urartu TaxID=4572 RepID=M7Z2V3_TRIUA|nr:hypothetical protein TRIUR3_32592 [Triticum urartu]